MYTCHSLVVLVTISQISDADTDVGGITDGITSDFLIEGIIFSPGIYGAGIRKHVIAVVNLIIQASVIFALQTDGRSGSIGKDATLNQVVVSV